jgi:hypothetical protein
LYAKSCASSNFFPVECFKISFNYFSEKYRLLVVASSEVTLHTYERIF